MSARGSRDVRGWWTRKDSVAAGVAPAACALARRLSHTAFFGLAGDRLGTGSLLARSSPRRNRTRRLSLRAALLARTSAAGSAARTGLGVSTGVSDGSP